MGDWEQIEQENAIDTAEAMGAALRAVERPNFHLSALRRSDGDRPWALDLGAYSSGERCPPAKHHGRTATGSWLLRLGSGGTRRRRVERLGKLRQAEGDGPQRCADGRQRRLHAGIANRLQQAVMRCGGFESPYLHQPRPARRLPGLPPPLRQHVRRPLASNATVAPPTPARSRFAMLSAESRMARRPRRRNP